MAKLTHEFRDPIHTFIRVDDDERRVIDTEPVQRLRHIHQLSLSYLVYPAATHRRFEHSLGVMDLASRVFEIVTTKVHGTIHDVLPELSRVNERGYWEKALRMAALSHDIGHLPFSHAAEDVLPADVNHENITVSLIMSPLMMVEWERPRPQLVAEDIAKLAVGPEHFTESPLTSWQAILSEIITGSAFGVDRMDYLLRDSYHAGVAYGRFDHFRLIDTLRILPQFGGESDSELTEPQLGVEEGGLQSAEALLLARYFMFTQVYFHRVRRIFDLHLQDFLREFVQYKTGDKYFPVNPEDHIRWTDAEVTAGMFHAARDRDAPGHEAARRIVFRDPFRLLWERTPSDIQSNPNAGEVLFNAVQSEFGSDAVRRDSYFPRSPLIDFPVLMRNGRVESARSLSEVLERLPTAAFDFIFIRPDIEEAGRR